MTETELIQKPMYYSEKYFRIKQAWPNKAGKLKSILEAQKRLITALAKERHSDKVKALIVSVAESYDVSDDILNYTHELLQDVAKDSEALREGAKLREQIREQSTEISLLWDHLQKK